MNLEPFTKVDWMAFAGCESKKPLIGNAGNTTLVVDGNWVEAHNDKGGKEVSTTCTFTTKGQALLFAMQVSGRESPEALEKLIVSLSGKVTDIQESEHLE